MIQNLISSPQLLTCVRDALPADREQLLISQINSLYALATDQRGRQSDYEVDLDHCIVMFMNLLAKILLAQNHTLLQVFSIFAMYKCVLENKMIVDKKTQPKTNPHEDFFLNF